MTFQYHLPVNLVFGRGQASRVGEFASRYGQSAMVVTGTGSTKKSGLLDRTLSLLQKQGLQTVVFDEVTQNPLTETAEKGACLAKETGCDVIVGLGGGSVMDCAKAIAFLAVNEGDISDYIFGKKTGEHALPLILVPTTCGTGSEGNSFAVLTNPVTGDKKSLRTNAVIAKASLIDSALMETMPQSVLAAVGFDALCHLMEAYLSKNAQPLSDMMCLSGISLIAEHLPRLYDGAGSDESWDSLAWASTLGGMAIHTAGVTLPHGMEHPASGLRNLVHGRGLAALTPVITEKSIAGSKEKYAQIAVLLGGRQAGDCAGQIRKLTEKLSLAAGLSDLGVQKSDIPWMSENCIRVSKASIENHPVLFSEEEIQILYELAL